MVLVLVLASGANQTGAFIGSNVISGTAVVFATGLSIQIVISSCFARFASGLVKWVLVLTWQAIVDV